MDLASKKELAAQRKRDRERARYVKYVSILD